MIAFNGYLVDPWDLLYVAACLVQGAIVFALILASDRIA